MALISRTALLSGCLGITLLAPAARAGGGFVGDFAPDQWSLMNTNPDQTLTDPVWACGSANQVACLGSVDGPNGAVTIVGSAAGQTGGGSSNTTRTTTWMVTNNGPDALLSFEWSFIDIFSDPNIDSGYVVDAVETLLGANNGDSGSIVNLDLPSSRTFGLRVSTADNNGFPPGILSISNFMATPSTIPPRAAVPGPLPVAGAIAGFGLSRRLRRRIRAGGSA